jgi:cobalt-zinc-cadmium efflux system outer membrane protein
VIFRIAALAIFLPVAVLHGQRQSEQSVKDPGVAVVAAPTKHLETVDEGNSATLLTQAVPDNSVPQPVGGTPLVLTLTDAIAMAEKNSPRLHEATAVTQRAVAARRAAQAYTNPSVEVFEGDQYAKPISTPGVPGLLQHYAGYQTIEIPSERRARQQGAQFAISSSRSGEQTISLSVVSQAEHAFYSALRRREEIQHAEENLQLVQDLLRRVQVEVDVGEKGGLELTRAQAEVARATFTVRSAQLEYANAIAILRVAVAAPAEANLDPRGEFEPRQQLPPLQEVRERVLGTHPAIAQTQADIEAARASLRRERALRIPQPTAFAEYENQPDLSFWRAGFTIPLPLWDRRQGQIGEATAAIAQSSAILEQRRLELISATERAYEQYQLADQQATSLEAGSLRAAESAVEAAKSAYRFGERGIIEVLDAQRVLQSVRGDLLDAQYARQSAQVDLEELGAIARGAKH